MFKSTRTYHFKIESLKIRDKDFNQMPLGRQIEYFKQIQAFKESAKTKHNHFSQKRTTFNKGLKEFLKLYNVKEYYTVDNTTPYSKDDSTEIWYTSFSD